MSVSTQQANVQQNDTEPTEDEYYEQELLDFLQIIESIQSEITNNASSFSPTEPKDEIECIITRFNKIDSIMPSDQWSRVYSGLKQLSQIITSRSESFESWALLRDLFESAKKFRKKYPTPQSGQQQQKQKSMHQVLKFAQEFADDEDITMKDTKHDNNHNIIKTKMTKSVKQSSIAKIKQIKKKPIKSESSAAAFNINTTQKPSKSVISKNSEKIKKAVPLKDELSKKRLRERDRDRSHRHRHRHRSRSRSRSRSRERHRRTRHGHSYRSRSTSKNRDRPPATRHPRSGNNRPHEPDEWGLPPPIHTTEYITNMAIYQSQQRDLMTQIDISLDDIEKIPVAYGDSEICHGFNEGRCRLDPCKYHHVCWSCKGRGHPSSICPYKATRPYDAPPSHHKPCVNWNIHGCPGGCLCADRHICLFCRGYHPMRHSAVCAWKFNREIEMKKRKAFDNEKGMKHLQNLNPIGQYEHLRLKDEENGTFEDKNSNNTSISKGYMHSNTYNKGGSITPPPSMTIPTSFMAKSVEKDETVSITEICVLYNTPSGCPATYGKNDGHLHYDVDTTSTSGNVMNPNTFNGICQLKHRCRECFGRHSFFECPFRYHGIKCFIVNDIVRYKEFPKRVYVVNGFIDRRDSYHRYSKHSAHGSSNGNNNNMKSKQLSSPKIKITEVGLDMTAAQIEIAASTLSKIVSSVKMQYKYPKMMIKELPTTISSQQVENKLKLLFHEKGVTNIVKMQSTISQSNWIISFLSVVDRLSGFKALNGCSMQSRELKLSLFDDTENDPENRENDGDETEDKIHKNKNELKLITKDEVPVHEHLYYCKYCDIGLFEYGLLRRHLLSSSHVSQVRRKNNANTSQQEWSINERINVNECILCGVNVMNTTMSDHITSTNHDNSNILMMLSLLRCTVNTRNQYQYHCQVCNLNLNSSRQYFIHCNSEKHRTGLEEAIEPCPYFNKRGSGCQNERCQFKHVCVGCATVTPIYRCKRCKNNEVCNMFNKGGAGCWYARGSCHRRHICHYCHGSHPKVGCVKLFPNNKKQFNSQGQEIKAGSVHHNNHNNHQNNHKHKMNQNKNENNKPPPPQPPPPPNASYPPSSYPPHAYNQNYPPPPAYVPRVPSNMSNMPPPHGYPMQPPPNMPSYAPPPPNYPYPRPPHQVQYPPQQTRR